MFRDFFDRLFKRQPQPARPSPPRPVARAADEPRPRAPGPAPVGIGARRPLVAPGGMLAGFEFHAGAASRGRLRRLEDEVTTRACTANVLGAMRLCIGQKLAALAEVPASWLARCDDEAFCAGMHLVLCADALFDDAAGTAALLARLRRAGVAVGWRPPLQPGDVAPDAAPDFLLLQLPATADASAWRACSQAVSARWPGVSQVLLDLPDVDQMEAMLRPPVTLAACRLDAAAATPAQTQVLSPQARHLLQLLNRLVRDDDNALLIADIKADAALSLRLLQYLNSAGASPGRALESVDQAVMVLGRDALYRWVAQMLVRLSPPRGSAEAMQAMALARARLLELLARSAGDANPGSLYLFGLVSMLPLLLRCSVEDAVASLQLPVSALDALRGQSGPWHPYLALAQALERHDMAAVETLAQRFGGIEAVLACSVRAWLPK